jgi:RNA polymerase sigma-70 factor (ECF subfamily)
VSNPGGAPESGTYRKGRAPLRQGPERNRWTTGSPVDAPRGPGRQALGAAARQASRMTRESDSELVVGVRGGSRDAAGKLAERYLRACRAVALSILGDLHAAEDVCQDSFVQAIERIEDCRQPERFGAWLLQIVRNRSKNFLRDGKGDREVSFEDGSHTSASTPPDREAERAELRGRLLEALKELPETRREILLLHDLEGWTHREIAERLELPAGTVRSHLHHARKALRSLLGETDGVRE